LERGVCAGLLLSGNGPPDAARIRAGRPRELVENQRRRHFVRKKGGTVVVGEQATQ